MSKEERIDKLVSLVNDADGKVSIAEAAEALDVAHSTAYDDAMKAIEDGRIDGDKSTPVIGYLFPSNGDDSELEVLTSKNGLLWAVDEYAPERLSEARARESLDSLRRFVRNNVAEGTVPVNYAWRLYPA